MKYIRTPTGDIFKEDECEKFESDLCKAEVFFNYANQEISARKMFEATGIMIADFTKAICEKR